MTIDHEGQQRQRTVEKALYRYSSALARGDFDTVAAVLHEAEQDPALEQMILELHAEYQVEEDAIQAATDAEIVRGLLRTHLPSGQDSQVEETTPTPITIGDVVARLQADVALGGQSDREIKAVSQRLRQSNKALPENLSQRGISRLFEQIGVDVSKRFQKLFRDTAIFLSMGREQGMTRLAATRHQRRLDEQHLGQPDAGTEEEEHDGPAATT